MISWELGPGRGRKTGREGLPREREREKQRERERERLKGVHTHTHCRRDVRDKQLNQIINTHTYSIACVVHVYMCETNNHTHL